MKVALISSDGQRVEVDRAAAELSDLLKRLLEERDEDEDQEVPLPEISGAVLNKIAEYIEHYKDKEIKEIEKPLKAKIEHLVDSFDREFLKMDQIFLGDVLLGANYLQIKGLVDLCCANIASMMKDKTPEQIRETFNIENDFTPEEEAKIKEENKWAEKY